MRAPSIMGWGSTSLRVFVWILKTLVLTPGWYPVATLQVGGRVQGGEHGYQDGSQCPSSRTICGSHPLPSSSQAYPARLPQPRSFPFSHHPPQSPSCGSLDTKLAPSYCSGSPQCRGHSLPSITHPFLSNPRSRAAPPQEGTGRRDFKR